MDELERYLTVDIARGMLVITSLPGGFSLISQPCRLCTLVDVLLLVEQRLSGA